MGGTQEIERKEILRADPDQSLLEAKTYEQGKKALPILSAGIVGVEDSSCLSGRLLAAVEQKFYGSGAETVHNRACVNFFTPSFYRRSLSTW